jgi:hypothetical protein
VRFVIEERAVVGDDDEERQAVPDRRPERGRSHKKIAVAQYRDRQAPAVGKSKGRADR